ncbi:protein disulfide oxidoreductase [Rodentibacter myodis]|uniref:Protein disulfide oxidoreductase n=1 Tax=Rodentibacter myodis TaxID=1907939 RepID=A0A1V3JKX7_9PAST|nr:protein disulfide oxidoreductase [Rodentibacter myodis]OOF57430.1 protein disulfide oxidoreductase [Rodentibacter myodis]
MKLKKWIKNALSLGIAFIVIGSVLDFVRRPTVPAEMNTAVLQDIQGKTFSLSGLDQKQPTIIYFWGSWCGYCRHTSPAINSLAKEGYSVISIALRSGSESQVADYLKENGYEFTTVNDPQGQIAHQWQVSVTPTIIILNKGKMDLATTGWTSYWGLKVRLFFTRFLG